MCVYLAFERPILGMFLHLVRLPISLLIELRVAFRALPGLGFGMDHFVLVQIALGRQSFVADVALISGLGLGTLLLLVLLVLDHVLLLNNNNNIRNLFKILANIV